MERTFKVTQDQIKSMLDLKTQSKIFSLDLSEFGPYYMDYSRDGTHMVIAGQKGHIATFDWKTGKLGCEIHLGEQVKDVKYFHNESLFAVAQKKYTYIYDKQGLEIHCLRRHEQVNKLDFLPYHFLLATVGNTGVLRYLDVSTGANVADLRTGLGKCNVMSHNPQNGVIHLGHNAGQVTLWSPNSTTPLVKMLAHKGPLSALSVDPSGKYMATAGLDSQVKIWDLRTYRCLQEYFSPSPVHSMDISGTGLLGLGFGPHVTIWKDAFTQKAQSPYMSHLEAGSRILDVRFCPYEDVLGFGHDQGISSIIIPGAGDMNYDGLEVNPNATKKQRQEGEVQALLHKLQPDMISLDPDMIGGIMPTSQAANVQAHRAEAKANSETGKIQPKHKMRGKSSSLRRYLRKQGNVIDGKREALRANLEKKKQAREMRLRQEKGEVVDTYDALNRFTSKPRF